MDTQRTSSTAVPTLPPAAIAALHQGNKIEAIKIVRTERDLGLKEAKDAVEDYVRTQPSLQSAFANAQSESKRGALLWVAAVIAVALVVYLFSRG